MFQLLSSTSPPDTLAWSELGMLTLETVGQFAQRDDFAFYGIYGETTVGTMLYYCR